MHGKQRTGVVTSILLLVASGIAQADSAPAQPKGFEQTPAALRALEEILLLAERERSSTDPVERRRLLHRIAQGLGHDEWYVRGRCIELLTKAQDAAAAHEHLIAGAARMRQDFDKRNRALGRYPAGKLPRADSPLEDWEDLQKFLKQVGSALEHVAQFTRLIDDYLLLREAYRRGLVRIAEEPRRRGLLALLRSTGPDPKLMEALLEVADESVIAALGDAHAAIETAVRTANQQLTTARSMKPRAVPKHRHDKEEWTTQERTRIERAIQEKADALEVQRSALFEFGEQVMRFAAAQSLPPAPPGSSANANWRAWCASARRAFAERSAK